MPESVEDWHQTKPYLDENGKELSEEEVQQRIEELRKLIEGDKNLSVRTEDSWLKRWLYTTHFSVEKAHSRLRAFYKLKADHPDFYYTDHPEKMQSIVSSDYKVMLENRDKDGRKIFITRLGRVPNNLSFLELVYTDDLWVEGALQEPETQQNGISAIIDLANCPWRIMKWLTPYNMRIGAQKSELCPITDLRYHIVNTSALLNAAIAMVFPFLSSYTKERVHFHYSNWDSLHKFISPDVLPPEYGGTARDIDHNKQVQRTIYDRCDQIIKSVESKFIPNPSS